MADCFYAINKTSQIPLCRWIRNGSNPFRKACRREEKPLNPFSPDTPCCGPYEDWRISYRFPTLNVRPRWIGSTTHRGGLTQVCVARLKNPAAPKNAPLAACAVRLLESADLALPPHE